ncbi:hypothetical protein HYALB_00013143 [Hymenoscyphus albidus]|uniref:Cupin type-1 domain-containing protein n=1 Tax=Hymenoscyphus albidus TaxID=595503 RepID=A0A9N9Q9P7_9HELO|nr:hypothetical protein HYALB_00013143 [Hymenoscyphus albidus]
MLIHKPFIEPKTYLLPPTAQVPNSRFPIIHYQQAIPNATPESTAAAIQPNGWYTGGQWKAYYQAHFHAVTHECYGVISGAAIFSLGNAPGEKDVGADGKEIGVKVRFERGDVFVLPSGVSHCVFEDLGGFEYVGFYPPNSDRAAAGEEPFDMHLCNASSEETAALAVVAAKTPIPSMDPLYGFDGPLPTLWKEADLSWAKGISE